MGFQMGRLDSLYSCLMAVVLPADCLREVRCTVDKDKPIALVFDSVRGGAPLESLKTEECPADLLGPVFSGRGVIEWHRIKVRAVGRSSRTRGPFPQALD